ncbi:hypothetical protein F5B21DRAFT_524543 [Xylaria acuta]|nr:hypothetical protein F5B21DRAFT_524543 [Xylaria acuta]
MGNAKYTAFIETKMLPYIERFVLVADDVLEDAQDKKVAAWGHCGSSTVIGPWTGEFYELLPEVTGAYHPGKER